MTKTCLKVPLNDVHIFSWFALEVKYVQVFFIFSSFLCLLFGSHVTVSGLKYLYLHNSLNLFPSLHRPLSLYLPFSFSRVKVNHLTLNIGKIKTVFMPSDSLSLVLTFEFKNTWSFFTF